MLPGADFVLTGTQIILTGVGIGILIAAPVGPVNILCIQRTLSHGFWGGVAAGLGAVIGDGLITVAASFGITAISTVMVEHRQAIQVVGGLILLAFGARLMMTHPRVEDDCETAVNLAGSAGIIPQTFFLTVTNPGAILGVFALVGGLGSMIGGLHSYGEASLLVLSVMGGSLLWWFALARLIATIRHRLNTRHLRLINQFAGIVLIGFGVGLLARVAWQLL